MTSRSRHAPRAARLLLGALIGFVPTAGRALDFNEARHLLARAGFGPALEEVEEILPLSHAQAVEKILAQTRREPVSPPPDWVDDPPPEPEALRNMSAEERKAFRQKQRQQGIDLKRWWYQEMLDTDSPLTERMTLFWHNHFTSSLEKVKWPVLMYRQNLTLRRHACGNFRDLLHAMAKDPAMVIYLDSLSNKKGKPNENFARELLELFTLGEGHYTETDIKEAARAFTGWTLNRRTGEFRFAADLHDDGEKTFMGRAGRFSGEEVIDIVLANPQVSVYIVGKLWREFVSEEPDSAEIARLAAVFREADYAIKPVLAALFDAPRFRAVQTRGTLVKSPVELLVGTVRTLRIPIGDARVLVQAGRALGQDILDPPNVKGWAGGRAWIDATTLLARRQVVERAARGREMAGGHRENGPMRDAMAPERGEGGRPAARAARWRPDALWGGPNREPPDARTLCRLLLAVPPVHPVPEEEETQAVIAHCLLDPVYQLK